MDTAISNINNKICEKTNNEMKLKLIICPVEPNKHKSKCPAIIFADKRIANVKGRMKFLIVSIRTINIINAVGVFNGTKCANESFVIFSQ